MLFGEKQVKQRIHLQRMMYNYQKFLQITPLIKGIFAYLNDRINQVIPPCQKSKRMFLVQNWSLAERIQLQGFFSIKGLACCPSDSAFRQTSDTHMATLQITPLCVIHVLLFNLAGECAICIPATFAKQRHLPLPYLIRTFSIAIYYTSLQHPYQEPQVLIPSR